MSDNAILRAPFGRPLFTGSDRWALDVATCRRPAAEHARLMAWAHLKSRSGQLMRQTVVQREARAREARIAQFRCPLPGGDAA